MLRIVPTGSIQKLSKTKISDMSKEEFDLASDQSVYRSINAKDLTQLGNFKIIKVKYTEDEEEEVTNENYESN